MAVVQPRTLSDSNVLGSKDWRITIRSWLDSTTEPQEDDVDIFASFAIELIELKMLNELYLVLRYLFRVISEAPSCSWHSAYFQIVNLIQQSMLLTFKTKLHVETDMDCKCARLNRTA